jgi:hypothetical protein
MDKKVNIGGRKTVEIVDVKTMNGGSSCTDGGGFESPWTMGPKTLL